MNQEWQVGIGRVRIAPEANSPSQSSIVGVAPKDGIKPTIDAVY
jgi:hypothetical protein